MVLGIINGWEREHIRAVHDLGLEAVEFCMNHNYDSFEILAKKEEIKQACADYGVKVGSMGRWGMNRIDENGEVIDTALQHEKNLIDLASFLGCPVYNVGCNYTEGKSYYENCMIAVDYFRGLLDYAAGKNVKIAVYNCDWSNFVYGPKAWTVVLGALPELGIKYDTSHAINRRSDYLKEIADSVYDHVASMGLDVRNKRKTEIMVLNEAVSAEGRRLGVPTPTIDVLAHLIRALESQYDKG